MNDKRSRAAIEELRHRVVRAVNQACPTWDKADRDDLTQSILAALVARVEEPEGIDRFPSTYLLRMAYGVMVDELRRRSRRREVPLEPPISEKRAAPAPGPDRLVESAEIVEGIRACVARLQPDRSLAVRLHLLGCGVTEIARRTGWRNKRAENLLYRGLAEVRTCLAAKGWGP